MKATPIIEPTRKLTKKGNIVYVAVWSVEKSKNYPESIKYSFALISKGRRVIGYDYNPAEGHHRHYLKEGKLARENYKFRNIDKILIKFRKDVEKYEEDL